jgi:hypothetical protein
MILELLPLFALEAKASGGHQCHGREAHRKSQENTDDKDSEDHDYTSLSFTLHGAMGTGAPDNQSGATASATVGD